MDDEAPRLVYNPDDGSVELRFGARGVTIDGLDAELQFERMTPDGDAATPLWLAPAEADVLRKMIGYILDKVRITEGSKATLAELLPRVRAIAEAAQDAEDGGGASGAGGGSDRGGESGRGSGTGGVESGRGGGAGGAGSGRVVSIDRRPGSGARSPAGDGDRAARDDDRAGPTNPLDVPGVRRGLPPRRDDDRRSGAQGGGAQGGGAQGGGTRGDDARGGGSGGDDARSGDARRGNARGDDGDDQDDDS